jgi:hypothetical protein
MLYFKIDPLVEPHRALLMDFFGFKIQDDIYLNFPYVNLFIDFF